MSVLNKKQAALLARIVTATKGDEGFIFADPDSKEHKALMALGYIETNNSQHDAGGNVATRATSVGVEANDANDAPQTEAQPQGNQVMTQAATAAAAPAARTKFTIASVALPAAKRGGGRTGSTYPFAELEIGQSFFVPATEAKPDPAKSLASTVTSANERYSEVIPGEFRQNRKGNTVPKTKQLRLFAIRAVEDGAAWGFAGVKGAAVGRIELGEEDAE